MAFELNQQIRRRLNDDTLIWLTTVTPSGRPAPRLVWFLWTEGGCLIYSQPGAAKLAHITVNDGVTLNFNSAALGGDAVVLSGHSELAPDAPSGDALPELQAKYAGLLEAIGMTAEHFTSTHTVAMRVIPDQAWTIPA
jgi:PPOX class probable F420-dependent enzyme